MPDALSEPLPPAASPALELGNGETSASAAGPGAGPSSASIKLPEGSAVQASPEEGCGSIVQLSGRGLQRLPFWTFGTHPASVTSLDLSRNALSSFPNFFSSGFKHLRSLVLSHNKLSNPPESFFRLISLTNLDLSFNEIGDLPAALGRLTSLSSLSVRGNQITYLTSAVGRCQSLVRLDLRANRIMNLTSELGKCVCVRAGNPISSLPTELLRNCPAIAHKLLDDLLPMDVGEQIAVSRRRLAASFRDAMSQRALLEADAAGLRDMVREARGLLDEANEENERLRQSAARIEEEAESGRGELGRALDSVSRLASNLRKAEEELRESTDRASNFARQIEELERRAALATRAAAAQAEDANPAPTGRVALVFTDIQGSTSLWDADPEMMAEALREHNRILRECIRSARGFEVKTEGDAFMVAFPTARDALAFCLRAQAGLVRGAWPEALLGRRETAVERDARGDTIYRGLRIRAGIHVGSPRCEVDPVLHRMDYFGPMVNKAARVSGCAYGGQTVLSAAAHGAIWGPEAAEGGAEAPDSEACACEEVREAVVAPVGQVALKGIDAPEFLYHRALEDGLVATLRGQMEGLESENSRLEAALAQAGANAAAAAAEREEALAALEARRAEVACEAERMRAELAAATAERQASGRRAGGAARAAGAAGELRRAVDEADAQRRSLALEAGRLEETLGAAEGRLAEAEGALRAAAGEAACLRAAVADLAGALEVARCELRAALAAAEAGRLRADGAEAHVAEQRRALAALSAQKAAAECEIAGLRAALGAAEEGAAQAELEAGARLAGLQDELAEALEAQGALERSEAALRARLAAATDAATAAAAAAAAAAASAGAGRAERASPDEAELARARHRLLAAGKRIEALSARAAAAETVAALPPERHELRRAVTARLKLAAAVHSALADLARSAGATGPAPYPALSEACTPRSPQQSPLPYPYASAPASALGRRRSSVGSAEGLQLQLASNPFSPLLPLDPPTVAPSPATPFELGLATPRPRSRSASVSELAITPRTPSAGGLSMGPLARRGSLFASPEASPPAAALARRGSGASGSDADGLGPAPFGSSFRLARPAPSGPAVIPVHQAVAAVAAVLQRHLTAAERLHLGIPSGPAGPAQPPPSSLGTPAKLKVSCKPKSKASTPAATPKAPRQPLRALNQ
eukprot:tig00020903_g15077.t1